MEQPIIANGGVQYVPQIAVQYVYLDFDGELTSYNGEILTVDNVEVKDSSLTEERIANIVAELNAKYADKNVIFVTERPQNAEYSTIYIGKTEAFSPYGSFAGLAETIDKDNENKSDNAFVLLDSTASDEQIISTIAHETDHLLGTLDHGGEGLKSYASYVSGNNTIYVDGGHTQNGWPSVLETDYTGVVFPAPEVTVGAGGIARNIVTVTHVYSGGPVNGGATRIIDYELTVLTHGSAYDCIFQGGSMSIAAGAYVHNLSLLLPDSLATMGYTRYQISPNAILDGEIWVGKHILLNYVKPQSGAELHINAGGTVASSVISGLSTKLFVHSGGVAKNVNLISGAKLYVESGGSADLIYDPFESFGTISVMPGAIVTTHTYPVYYGNKQSGLISYGSTIDNVTVGSGYKLYVSSGGSASNITALDGAGLDIHVASNTYIQGTYGGSAFEMKDARISGHTVNSGGHLYVSSGGVANSTTVRGGYLVVSSGGVANSTTVNSVGKLYVYNGGVANSTSVNFWGYLDVLNGGVANSTTVRGGYLHVYNGGVANFTTVNSGGRLYVSSGGVANSTTVNSGGFLDVDGSALNIVENGGYVKIAEGANVTFTPNTIFGLILNRESATLHSGTVANETTANFYGRLYVSNGGVANSTTVNTGGYLYVSNGGVANSTTVNSDGELDVYNGGVANSTTVNSGGYLYVYNGGVANSTTVNSGGYLRVSSGGVANSTTVNSGGYLRVSSGGVANSTSVNSGGYLRVSSGGVANSTIINIYGDMYISGVANSTTVNRWGSMTISSGGVANSTTVNSSGYMYISSGGVANDTTVNSNGYLYVSSGGIHKGTLTMKSSAKVSAHTGSIIDFSVAERTVEDDCLINDLSLITGTPTYTITVSADQSFGTYKLAQGAENFTGSITIGDAIEDYGSITVNGSELVYNDITYSLDQADGNLTLTIAEVNLIPPEKPIAIPSTTEITNKDVTVSVTYSEDSTVKQYKIGENGEWLNYTQAFSVANNATIYLRAEDAAGNESTNELIISNIDKATPEIPVGFNETISGYDAKLDWLNATDSGVAGVKGYYVRYGTSEALTGEGVFVESSEFNVTDLAVGTYYYQVKTLDNADNISEWSEIQSFEVKTTQVQNLRGDSNGLSWEANPEVYWYIVEYSTDNFAHVISFEICSNKVDFHALPAGTYQWRVKAINGENFSTGENIISQHIVAEPQEFVSNADGNTDVFFANANGKWGAGYAAQHTGILNGWSGTNEQVTLTGKNKLADIFEGSSDANILVMTDDTNGDALFVDDIYTALPGTVAEQQARIAQIDEIRAGAGDDIVDMTSQRFEYIGDGVKIFGGLGNDTIWSNNGSNMLFGDAGNDRIVGGSDDNIIIGGIGNDSMHGGGGDDIFCFGEDWGNDTVEQLAGGSVTLWFEDGSASNWNASTLTYSDGANSVKVSGVDTVTLKFGAESSDLYDELAISGCFDDAASEKIFEDKNKGFLA